MIDIKSMKSVLEDAGYTMSEGDAWTASDYQNWLAYCRFQQTNTDTEKSMMGSAYEGILDIDAPEEPEEPEDPEEPDNGDGDEGGDGDDGGDGEGGDEEPQP